MQRGGAGVRVWLINITSKRWNYRLQTSRRAVFCPGNNLIHKIIDITKTTSQNTKQKQNAAGQPVRQEAIKPIWHGVHAIRKVAANKEYIQLWLESRKAWTMPRNIFHCSRRSRKFSDNAVSVLSHVSWEDGEGWGEIKDVRHNGRYETRWFFKTQSSANEQRYLHFSVFSLCYNSITRLPLTWNSSSLE